MAILEFDAHFNSDKFVNVDLIVGAQHQVEDINLLNDGDINSHPSEEQKDAPFVVKIQLQFIAHYNEVVEDELNDVLFRIINTSAAPNLFTLFAS